MWPVTWPLSRSTLRSILGRHSRMLSRFSRLERRLWSAQERRSERVSLGTTGAAYDFQLIAHAGQEALELVVAEVDPAGEEAADARLPHTAEPGQVRLRGARLEHHLAQHVATTRHAIRA